jgi:hypothetical protein
MYFLEIMQTPHDGFRRRDDGKGQLEFPNNTLSHSNVCGGPKTRNCPIINVGRETMRQMGMWYR